jgi:hypothetical protein
MFESIGKHGALILAILLIVVLLVVYIFNKMKTYKWTVGRVSWSRYGRTHTK